MPKSGAGKKQAVVSDEDLKKVGLRDLGRLSLGAVLSILTLAGVLFSAGFYFGSVQPDDVTRKAEILLETIPKVEKEIKNLESQRDQIKDQIESLKKDLPQQSGPEIQARLTKIQELSWASSETVSVLADLTEDLKKGNSSYNA